MILRVGFIFVILFIISSCSGIKELDTAQSLYKAGIKASKSGYSETALYHFKKLKSQFPYSKLSIQADLAIADVFYDRESFLEAEAAYKVFKDFHPKTKPDYIAFKLAMSIYKQLPDTVDRDISLAFRAIGYFNEVIKSYPKSLFRKKALAKRKNAVKKLAEKELYIANFYLKRKIYISSLPRYEKILKKYPNMGFNSKALYGAAVSAYKLNKKSKARSYLGALKKNHSSNSEYKKAKRIISN